MAAAVQSGPYSSSDPYSRLDDRVRELEGKQREDRIELREARRETRDAIGRVETGIGEVETAMSRVNRRLMWLLGVVLIACVSLIGTLVVQLANN